MEGNEVLAERRFASEIIDSLDEAHRMVVERKEEVQAEFLVHDRAMREHSAAISAGKASVAAAEQQEANLFKELKNTVSFDPGVDRIQNASITVAISLAEARQHEAKLREFEQLVEEPGTPILSLTRNYWQLMKRAGWPMGLSVDNPVARHGIRAHLKVQDSVQIRRNLHHDEEPIVILQEEDEAKFTLGEVYATYDSYNEEARKMYDELENNIVLVGSRAVNEFFRTKFNPDWVWTDWAVTSSVFGQWAGIKLFGHPEIDLQAPAEIMDTWKQQLREHAKNALLVAVDRRSDAPSIEFLRGAFQALPPTAEEVVQIYESAVEGSVSIHSLESVRSRGIARARDLMPVLMRHDLGLTVPEDAL